MCCTGCAPVRVQIAIKVLSRSFLSMAAAWALISSCAASARAISAITASGVPLPPIVRTGSSRWARAFSCLRSMGDNPGMAAL